MTISLARHDALLVVDMQNDFLPGGSLAVAGAETIIEQVNGYMQLFADAGLPVFASRDYHPPHHLSFQAEGGPWPPHCVAGSTGADFHPGLRLPDDAVIISKGTSRDKEAYSALDAPELRERLRELGTTRVFVCGVATDYCVHASARDLLLAGYSVVVLTDAVKAVDIQPCDGDRAKKELTEMGALKMRRGDLNV
jgi:nicotinamidase/pyrazinamidase